MSAPPDQLVDLHAVLRAAYETYRDSHWRVSGRDYYGNHLLLQRLYEETEPLVDALAERIVGLWGSQWLEKPGHLKRISAYSTEFSTTDPMLSAWRAANEVHELYAAAYKAVAERGQLTLGLDDLLMAQQSTVETHLYLLQQEANARPRSNKKLKAKLLR